jgi:hypothetical protein
LCEPESKGVPHPAPDLESRGGGKPRYSIQRLIIHHTESVAMNDLLLMLLIFGGYLAFQFVILPKLGVPT